MVDIVESRVKKIDWWEPARLAAMRSVPPLQKYESAIPCRRHPKPVRYLNTARCVDCSRRNNGLRTSR